MTGVLYKNITSDYTYSVTFQMNLIIFLLPDFQVSKNDYISTTE